MRAHGLRAEDEIVGDLPLGLSLREEAEDLLLAWAERPRGRIGRRVVRPGGARA